MAPNRFTKSEIQSIRSSLRDEMHRHLPKWRLQAKYISPHRLKEDSKKVDGRRKDKDIINNQAGLSLRTFVSGMMNGATPQSRPWFNLIVNDPSIPQNTAVKTFYSNSEKVLNRYFQASNTYRVLPLAYKDVGTFSNSAFAMLPHTRYGFYFYPFAIGTYAFASDKDGRTNMFTRDFTLTVRQVVETYGTLDPVTGRAVWDNIPLSIKQKYEQAKYNDEVVLTQVVLPNPSYNPIVKSLNPADKRFQSYTYVMGTSGSSIGNQSPVGFRQIGSTSKKEPDFIKISGFSYFPVITPRWEVEPEGHYGVDGPGETALADIMTLQVQEKFRLEGAEKLVRPPMVGHASLRRHHSSILAGGITYVDDRGMDHGFKPAFNLNPNLSELIGAKEDIQRMIKTAFYEDVFLQLSSERTISHVTAAQINQQAAEGMAVMAPVLGQWDFDMSGPMIENAQIILGELGVMPARPEELRGKEIVPEYISVLAQASKASLIASQERFVQFAANTSAVLQDPTLLRIVNGEQQIRSYADNLGIDPSLYIDENAFSKVREGQAQADALKAKMMQDQANAQNMKTLSDTKMGTGSALDQIA